MNIKKAENYYNGKEYESLLRARAQRIKEMSDSEYHRARLIMDVFAVDPIEFIETFLWIKLPNYHNAIKPFFMFDYQKDIIRKLQESEQDTGEHMILIDKPREMGLTWTILAYFYWRWLFTPDWSGFLLSRSEAEVDDNSVSPDSSMFGKLRWMIQNTPKFLIPETFKPRGQKGTSTDMALKLLNPTMGTAIIGSTTNQNAGRSRRYSMTFVDECFFVENFTSVWRALESVSRVKVFGSSAKQGKVFKDFVKLCDDKGDHIELTWRDHPWKDDEWFAELQRKAEFDPEIMKEAVVSYAIDAKSQYYPQIYESKVAPLEYDPSRPIYMSMDFGRSDLTVLIWWQYVDSRFHVIECYANKNKDIEWYVPFMDPSIQYNPDNYKTEVQQELLKKIRKWKRPAYFFGEQAHTMKVMPTNRSIADDLHKFGIRITVNNYAVKHEPRRHATSGLLPLTTFNEDSAYVMELYDSIANSKYTNSALATSKQTTLTPVHGTDGTADYRSAFENGAVNLPRILMHQRQDPRAPEVQSLARSVAKYLKS